MDINRLPTDMDALRQLIVLQQSQLEQRASQLEKQASELALKDKLVEQQAHSILELKANSVKLEPPLEAARAVCTAAENCQVRLSG